MTRKRLEHDPSDEVLGHWARGAADDFAAYQIHAEAHGLAAAQRLWTGREVQAQRVIVLVASLRSCRAALASRPVPRRRRSTAEEGTDSSEG